MWTETYAGIYQATCDRCDATDTGWHWIKDGSHDNGTRCDKCHSAVVEGHHIGRRVRLCGLIADEADVPGHNGVFAGHGPGTFLVKKRGS